LSQNNQRSLPVKQWILAERTEPDLLGHLLKIRKIDDRGAFLTPNFATQLHDPFLMLGMEQAVHRLLEAAQKDEVIGIFADYDTDGTPGAALLLDGFSQLDLRTAVYIPTRAEGYGLSEEGLVALKQAGATVVVTIDLGITARGEAERAQALGIDLIITDHHTVQAELFPDKAYAVVNPKQEACPYPFKELCGGGIAWKLLSAFLARLEERAPNLLRGRNPEAIRRWALDLAAIATVCDMVPLLGENRILAQYGLTVLRQTRRPGLKALFQAAGVTPLNLSVGTIGFQIGPRLNAPTRLAAEAYHSPTIPGPQASLPLGLLLTPSPQEAEQLAMQLQQYNAARQEQLDATYQEAEARVLAEGLCDRKIILLAQENWPVGIVGLVAGRLMERFGRPTIVLSITGEEATGSARSISGFHLIEALTEARAYLKRFGGHTKAAGLTLEVRHLQTVYDLLLRSAEAKLSDEALGPRLYLEAQLTRSDLQLEVARHLEQLGPHGIGNPRPLFLVAGSQILERRLLGANGQHAKLQLGVPGVSGRVSAIAFSWPGERQLLSPGAQVDLACYLALNTWNGQTSLQLEVVDARRAG
jgi:single-stranded-DNA-specific exonuclease